MNINEVVNILNSFLNLNSKFIGIILHLVYHFIFFNSDNVFLISALKS